MGMQKKYDARTINPGDNPFTFPVGKEIEVPESFISGGISYNTQAYLDSSGTTGLVVIQNDTLVYEKYFRGFEAGKSHISWSVAKSFVSALMGIAVDEGYIKSVNQRVEEYCPELAGSGYEGVEIKDVLQMADGVGFDEDYGDFKSDINRWGRGFAVGASQDKFAASLVREVEPGTLHHYVSINTHVLGMIIKAATGLPLSQYMEEKIWKPLGMQDKAYWLIDNKGMEVALGGMNISTRDFARLGQLYLQNGMWLGSQLISEDWIRASVTPDAPHLQPGTAEPFGYGYQWWVPEGREGEYMAMGVYDQFIYVNTATRTVIMKNSANFKYNEPGNTSDNPRVPLELFRAIAHQD